MIGTTLSIPKYIDYRNRFATDMSAYWISAYNTTTMALSPITQINHSKASYNNNNVNRYFPELGLNRKIWILWFCLTSATILRLNDFVLMFFFMLIHFIAWSLIYSFYAIDPKLDIFLSYTEWGSLEISMPSQPMSPVAAAISISHFHSNLTCLTCKQKRIPIKLAIIFGLYSVYIFQ